MQQEIMRNLIVSLIAVLVLIIIRVGVLKFIDKVETDNPDEKRKWKVYFTNIWYLFAFLVLVLIWAAAIKTLALSMVAFAVAIIVGTKELVLCLLGGIWKASVRPFVVGDRIEVGDFRGDVLNHSLLSTSLFEIGPGKNLNQYTGRTIHLPNSLLLSNGVVNETEQNTFVLHTFSVHLSEKSQWRTVERELIEAANIECKEFKAQAAQYFLRLAKRESIEPPSTEPKVFICFPDHEQITLSIRVPAPAKQRGTVEQAILRRALTRVDFLGGKA